jgi:thioredoxin reductase (NADPH)
MQAARFGANIVTGVVMSLGFEEDGRFAAAIELQAGIRCSVLCRTILLATGVVDIEPELPDVEGAIARGLVRHCPICDGYEARDQNIGVIGSGPHCAGEAMFLRAYSEQVTLMSLGKPLGLTGAQRDSVIQRGVRILEEPIASIRLDSGRISALTFRGGSSQEFDTIYSALGTRVRSDLARSLGVQMDSDGAIFTDHHQRTNVPGLFAVGDVVHGLNQISVAFGHAALAATAIHRKLTGLVQDMR